MYEYRAKVTDPRDIYDGDTIKLEVELGFHVELKKLKMRMFGINAPEMKGDTLEVARASRDRLRDLILNKELMIRTFKGADYVDQTGKYGRWLCLIFVRIDGVIVNVNDLLVEEGHAVVKDY